MTHTEDLFLSRLASIHWWSSGGRARRKEFLAANFTK